MFIRPLMLHIETILLLGITQLLKLDLHINLVHHYYYQKLFDGSYAKHSF